MSAFAVLALLFVAGAASPAGGRAGGAASSAFGVRIVLPGQAGVTVGEVSAPPRGAFTTSSFRYPADGSAVTSGSISASTSAAAGSAPSATAAADVSSLSLFDGDIVAADGLGARARLRRTDDGAGRRGWQRLRRAHGARRARRRADREPARRTRRLGVRAPARAGQRSDAAVQRLRHRARRPPHARPRRAPGRERDPRRAGRGERPGRRSGAASQAPPPRTSRRRRPTTCR